jgi:hypothetical protein
MSLSTGSAVVSAFSPALPAIAVLYGSLLVVSDGIWG